MSKLETLRDALLEELKDIYSAEQQLLKALPKLAKRASNEKLKAAFEGHLEETSNQVDRLEKISSLMKEKLSGKTCKAMKGLVEEGKEAMDEESDNEALIDALLIGAARRVEHYEVAAYSTACAMAKAIGEDEVARLLDSSLSEEAEADKKLGSISDNIVLKEANDRDSTDSSSKGRDSKSSAMRALSLLGIAIAASFFSPVAFAESADQTIKHEREAAGYKTDNTGRNSRDVNDSRKTADDQSLSGKETDVLARIRQEIVANDNLSTYGKNVKIIVESGLVTLRGPVKSLTEKTWIEDATTKIATGYKVVNQLEVAPS